MTSYYDFSFPSSNKIAAWASFKKCYDEALKEAEKFERLAAQYEQSGDFALASQLRKTAQYHRRSALEAMHRLNELSIKRKLM